MIKSKRKFKLIELLIVTLMFILATAGLSLLFAPILPSMESYIESETNVKPVIESPIEVPVAPLSIHSLAVSKCESQNKQFKEDGTPVINLNYNSSTGRHWSTDWGKYQINDFYWDKKANELGLNYKYSEIDNEIMAAHVYKIQGLKAWKASKDCWSKGSSV